MTPEEVRLSVISRAEEASNRPVLVTADATLSVLATVRIARGNAPAHVVAYNPAAREALDYLICFQCGFLIRLFEAPPANRFDVSSTYWGRKTSEKIVTEKLRSTGSGPSKEVRAKVAEQMYDGIIRQLRSMPVGLRVDQWLSNDFPELRDQQHRMIERQLQENLQALSPQIAKMSPEKILRANLGMNAANALFWSHQWSDPKIFTPYVVTGHAEIAAKLNDAWASVPANPASDRDLIDAWGKETGLEGWYEFVPAAVS